MDTGPIVTLLLTSSLISAGLTSLIAWRINKANYKREYYKKLLDKRLDACEYAESLVRVLSGFIQTKSGALCPMVLAGGESDWAHFLAQILQVGSKSFWLSTETSGIITEINVFLINGIENLINPYGDYDEELQRFVISQPRSFVLFDSFLTSRFTMTFRI